MEDTHHPEMCSGPLAPSTPPSVRQGCVPWCPAPVTFSVVTEYCLLDLMENIVNTALPALVSVNSDMFLSHRTAAGKGGVRGGGGVRIYK